MTRLGVAALGAAAAIGLLCGPARAQDGDAAAPWRFEARALDYSTMLQSQHGAEGAALTEVALSRVPVHVLIRAPGRASQSLETETDLVGRFVVEGESPPPGATLEFFVAGEDGTDSRPGFYARPWAVDDGAPPEAVQFFQVATEPPVGLILANVINIVSVVDRDESTKVVQLRHTAMLANQDFKVWLGDLSRSDFSTFGIRIPEGFELRNVTVDNVSVDASDIGRSGHNTDEKWLYRQPIFPDFRGGKVFQAMFVAPYEDGREYDVSWHNEYPVMQYALNIQQDLFAYVPPASSQEGLALIDGGVNPPMGNTQIVTHSYRLQQVGPHQTLSARFVAGRPFPWKAVTWTGTIVLLAAGAGLLGLWASKPRREHDEEVAQALKRAKVPATEEGREHELEMLARRLRRGEITSVEHDVRKAAIESAARAPAPSRPAGRGASRAVTVDVAAIAARVDDADAAQLRDDVRALLKAVRELHGER